MNNVVDFPDEAAIEKEAAEWLIRLDGDVPLSDLENSELKQWVNASAAHEDKLKELAGLWGQLNVLTDLAVPIERSETAPRAKWIGSGTGVRLAAAAVVILGVGLVITQALMPDPLMESNGFYSTAVGEQKTLELSDESVVLLNTNTQIKVSYRDDGRDVYLLQGEAHFSVAKNEAIPFRVYAGAGQIRAIGTAFTVYLKTDGVDVIVTEGVVALAAVSSQPVDSATNPGTVQSGQIGLVPTHDLGQLEAGQSASIVTGVDEHHQRVESISNLKDVENQALTKRLAWTEGVLAFSGEPLEQVVKEISRYTTVKIEFSDPDVMAIRIGGRFPVGETDEMFNSLEANFGLQITHLSNDRVLISADNQ